VGPIFESSTGPLHVHNTIFKFKKPTAEKTSQGRTGWLVTVCGAALVLVLLLESTGAVLLYANRETVTPTKRRLRPDHQNIPTNLFGMRRTTRSRQVPTSKTKNRKQHKGYRKQHSQHRQQQKQ